MNACNTPLQQLRSTLALHAHQNTQSKWWSALAMLWGALFAVIVALAGVMFWIRVPVKDWASLVKIPVFGLVASAAILICMGLVGMAMWLIHQFRPTHMALVPHMRARLPQAAALFCATVALATALPVALWVPDLRPVLVGLGVLGILIALIVVARSVTVAILLFGSVLASFLEHTGTEQWTGAAKGLLAEPVIGIPFGAAIVGLIAHWTFALRGDKHTDITKRSSSMQWALKANTRESSPTAIVDIAVFKHYLSWRLRVSKAPENGVQFMLALGPMFHWVSGVTATLLLSSFAAVLLMFLPWLLNENQPGPWVVLIATQLAALSGFYLMLFQDMARTAVHKTRNEQALLLLAERAPSLQTQSKDLIPYLVRQYLTVWCMSTLVIISLGALTHIAVLEFQLVICLAFAMLPCTSFLIRNYAADDFGKRLTGLMNGILPVFAINGALILIAVLVHLKFALVWCLGMALLTAALWSWRFRQVSRHGDLLLPEGRAS